MESSEAKRNLLQTCITFFVLIIPSLCIELFDTFLFASTQFDFSFDRQLIAEGQWWRILSGHFDHLGWTHFGLNALFLGVLLFTFAGLVSAQGLVALVCVCSLMISALIWLCSPSLSIYVGLSGSLYALLAFALLRDVVYPLWLRASVYLGLLSKVVYEYVVGASQEIGDIIGGAVAVDVHVYGVLVGTLSVLALRVFRI